MGGGWYSRVDEKTPNVLRITSGSTHRIACCPRPGRKALCWWWWWWDPIRSLELTFTFRDDAQLEVQLVKHPWCCNMCRASSSSEVLWEAAPQGGEAGRKWRVLLDENTKPTADTLKAAADKIELLRFHDSVELMLEARTEERATLERAERALPETGHALNDLHRFGALLLVTNESACTMNTNDVLNLLSHECRKEAFLVWLRSATSAALVESASKDGAVSPHAQVMVRKV